MSLAKLKKLIAVLILIVLVALGFYMGFTTIYPYKYIDLVLEFSEKYDVSPSLVSAMIHAESRFRPHVVSSKGASGLMQLTKQTADWGAEEIGMENYDYSKIYDPVINIELGCWYINNLLRQFNGERDVALAAYNAGSGNVSKWLQDAEYSRDGKTLHYIPFGETRNYVEKINKNIPIYKIMLRILGGVNE